MPEGAEGVELAWTSSDDKIATVDKDGNVKAVAEGKATLTVTATQGSGDSAVTKTATVDVTYKDANSPNRERGTYRRESVS